MRTTTTTKKRCENEHEKKWNLLEPLAMRVARKSLLNGFAIYDSFVRV